MIFLVVGYSFLIAAFVGWLIRSGWRKEEAFARERQEWARERGELLTRIQAPQAAPFMFEADPKDAENDMPTLPGFTMDEEELERAKQELEEAGYSEGPVG